MLVVRLWTIEGWGFEGDLSGVALGDCGKGLATRCLGDFAPGETSGESEGNDSRVLAEVGVTRECFRDPVLAELDFREAVDIWEEVRSKLPLPLLRAAMLLRKGCYDDSELHSNSQDDMTGVSRSSYEWRISNVVNPRGSVIGTAAFRCFLSCRDFGL